MSKFCCLDDEQKKEFLNTLPTHVKEILLDFICSCYHEYASTSDTMCDICGILTGQAIEVLFGKNMRWLPFAKPPLKPYVLQPFIKVKGEEC